MYLNYDYYVTHSTSLIEFRDPNTGYIERFIPSGGTSTAWIPGPGVTYGSSASYTTSGGTSHVTIVLPGGATLFFDQTSWAPSGGAEPLPAELRRRPQRQQNQLQLREPAEHGEPVRHGMDVSSPIPTATESPAPAIPAPATFPCPICWHRSPSATAGRWPMRTTATTPVSARPSPTRPRGPCRLPSRRGRYASGGTVTINDWLLPSDNYGWQVLVDPSSYGRVRATLCADHATYAYVRAVSCSGGTSTTLIWNQGTVQQIVNSPQRGSPAVSS